MLFVERCEKGYCDKSTRDSRCREDDDGIHNTESPLDAGTWRRHGSPCHSTLANKALGRGRLACTLGLKLNLVTLLAARLWPVATHSQTDLSSTFLAVGSDACGNAINVIVTLVRSAGFWSFNVRNFFRSNDRSGLQYMVSPRDLRIVHAENISNAPRWSGQIRD